MSKKEKTKKDTEDSNNATITRELQLIDGNGNGFNEISNFLGGTIEFNKNEGTPQKRIYFLFVQCEYIFLNILKWTKQNFESGFKNYKVLIDELDTASRDSLPSVISKYDVLTTKIITTLLSSLKNQSIDDNDKTCIALWISILVKSISDISLCGSLVNLIPIIYSQLLDRQLNSIEDIEKIRNSPDSVISPSRKVEQILKGNINLVSFSSDLITGGLSTNIVKLFNYPIQILSSTKESGITTQTIILQKNEISTLSIILSYIGNIDELVNLQDKIIENYPEHFENITNCLIKINYYVCEFYENILPLIHSQVIDNFQNNIQKVFDDLFRYQNRDDENNRNNILNGVIQKLYTLIYNISNIPDFVKNLKRITDILIIPEEKFIVNRWTYHLLNDIFKYMFPLFKELFENPYWGGKTLKEAISQQEVLSATFDAMYGHDFKFNFMRTLGNAFLKSIGEQNNYQIEHLAASNFEQECIIQTLEFNNYSTLNQNGDKFSIILNSKNNFLVADKQDMFFRSPEVQWNITLSPLFKQKLYSSIDFVSGEPAISLLLVEQVNYIKQLSSEKVYVYDIVNDASRKNTIKKISDEINKKTNYIEIFNPCSLFDGAAPYGGKPFYILSNYETYMEIKISRKGKSPFIVKFSIITKTTQSEESLTENWVQNRIKQTNEPKLDSGLVNLKLITPSELLQNTSPEYNNNVIKFNEIWGTILNSSNKLSNETKGLMLDTFRKIIGNINEEVAKLNQQSSSVPKRVARGRQSENTSNVGNYFDNYDKFNNVIISQFITNLQQEILRKNTSTFNQLMIYFVKIIIQQEKKLKYQQAIKTFLIILEMCIRKTIVINPNGIYKGLPISSVGEVVINNNEGNTKSSWFQKQLQMSYNKILFRESAIKEIAKDQETKRLKLRGESQSVTKTQEKNMMDLLPENLIENNQNLTPIPENITKVNKNLLQGQSFSSSSQGFGSQVETQRDSESGNEEENEKTNLESPKVVQEENKSESLITPESRDRNERMPEQMSTASSTTTLPSRGPINPVNPPVKSNRSADLRARQAKRKLGKLGGTNNKVTFKHYKKSNNNYSIKNKQHFFKSKTIKHNKRKHTKTYKRK